LFWRKFLPVNLFAAKSPKATERSVTTTMQELAKPREAGLSDRTDASICCWRLGFVMRSGTKKSWAQMQMWLAIPFPLDPFPLQALIT